MEFTLRTARPSDSRTLALLNRQLIRAERSRNPMSLDQLEERMRGWLEGDWSAVMIVCREQPAGYCLYQMRQDDYLPGTPLVYVRHYCVAETYRGEGLGRAAFEHLVAERFPAGARLVLDVLESNPAGRAFWHALGFQPYCTTLERMAEGQ